jgi:hypothetical protein
MRLLPVSEVFPIFFGSYRVNGSNVYHKNRPIRGFSEGPHLEPCRPGNAPDGALGDGFIREREPHRPTSGRTGPLGLTLQPLPEILSDSGGQPWKLVAAGLRAGGRQEHQSTGPLAWSGRDPGSQSGAGSGPYLFSPGAHRKGQEFQASAIFRCGWHS